MGAWETTYSNISSLFGTCPLYAHTVTGQYPSCKGADKGDHVPAVIKFVI